MEKRPGEIALPFDPAEMAGDAHVVFVGRIRTPWHDRHACPRRGTNSDVVCRVEVDPPYRAGLKSLEGCSHLYLLYWMHEAPRNLIVQAPAFDDKTHGVFALRSPARPNPIALSVVDLLEVDPEGLRVRGLDCLDGTPLLDIKPYFPDSDARPDAQVAWRGSVSHPGRRSTELGRGSGTDEA